MTVPCRLGLLTVWFGVMTAISATSAWFAYRLLQTIRPTVYMRQSGALELSLLEVNHDVWSI
jgi:hypothetical protein